MGARGPQPKPTALKEVLGNPGKRPLPKAEPLPIGAPVMPEHLEGDAAIEWDRVVRSMPPQLYTSADVSTLLAYCTAWALHKKAWLEVKRKGLFAKGSMGQLVANPALAVLKSQAEVMLKAGDRLGLSPAARARLEMPDAQNEDPEDALFSKH